MVKDDERQGNTEEESANGLRNRIMSTGYHRLELKMDVQPAPMDVAKKTKEAEVDIIPNNPPAYDSQSNGLAERAAR